MQCFSQASRQAQKALGWCRAVHLLFRGKVPGKTPRWLGGFFRNDADHRDFTAIGTAAGQAFQIGSNCFSG